MLGKDFREFVELLNSTNVEYLLVTLGGVTLTLIDVDDLRANKRAAGRPKDIADLDSLGD